jgi:hypothetical protein
MPTEIPYLNEFEKWGRAQWRAGIHGHEKLGEELMLEDLVNEIHRQNREKDDLLDYEIPTGPELDESDTGPSERSLRNKFGSYDEALERIGFLRLKESSEEDQDWRDLSSGTPDDSRADVLED